MTRNTIQRILVLNAVTGLQNHPTADEVYKEVAKEHPDISKATVYRNLNRLSKEGRICRRVVPGGPDRYDHLCGDHYHVKCERCGRVFDVDMDFIPDLVKHVRDTRGFMLKGHGIVFTGICPDCLEAGGNPSCSTGRTGARADTGGGRP